MAIILLVVFIRIFSNSYLNVLQKVLTLRGEHSSVVNFYSYLGLSILGIIFCQNLQFNGALLGNILLMGLLGAIGNYFIIKALSYGELSTLAPINSYKPIVALFFGFFFLEEYPNLLEIFGVGLIIIGSFILTKTKMFYNKAVLYRIFALIFSGIEAIFIKKVILLTDISSAFFYWAITGLFFSMLFLLISGHKVLIRKNNIKYQLFLILMVALMQYSTNYVFSRMNVAYALALFQLSTIVSVFLGVNIFKEKDLTRKLIASLVMIFGAIIIILNMTP